jgi:hypothetical protein
MCAWKSCFVKPRVVFLLVLCALECRCTFQRGSLALAWLRRSLLHALCSAISYPRLDQLTALLFSCFSTLHLWQDLANAQAEAEAARAQASEAEEKKSAYYTANNRRTALLTNEVERLRRRTETVSSQLEITHGVHTACASSLDRANADLEEALTRVDGERLKYVVSRPAALPLPPERADRCRQPIQPIIYRHNSPPTRSTESHHLP